MPPSCPNRCVNRAELIDALSHEAAILYAAMCRTAYNDLVFEVQTRQESCITCFIFYLAR
jgi:hypothetical protein